MSALGDAILALSPHNYWPLAEAGAPIAEDFGSSGDDGNIYGNLITGGSKLGTGGPILAGSSNSCVFDGSTDARIHVNTSAIDPLTQWTVCLVAEQLDTNRTAFVSGRYAPGPFNMMFGYGSSYGLGGGGVSDLWAGYYTGSTWHAFGTASNGQRTDGRFLTFTYDGDAIRLYEDGVQLVAQTGNGGAVAGTGGRFYIGTDWADSLRFHGRMSDVAIWDHALSPTAVADLYTASITGDPLPTTAKVSSVLTEALVSTDSDARVSSLITEVLMAVPGPATETDSLANAVTTLSPKYYWRLNEVSGTNVINYGSVASANGTTQNSPARHKEIIMPGGSKSTEFISASSQYISVSNAGLTFTSAWTVSVLVQPTGTDFYIITNTYTGHGIPVFVGAGGGELGYGGGTYKFGGAFYNGAWRYPSVGTTFTPGLPYHVVSTWDGTTLKTYQNNVLIGTGTPGVAATLPENDIIYIGTAWNAGSLYMKGQMSDLAVWDRALTIQEIDDLYTAASSEPIESPEPTGSTAALVLGKPRSRIRLL